MTPASGSAKRGAGDDKNEDANDGASPLPFVGALVIILLVVIGIGWISLSNQGADNQREAVVRAALAANDALQRRDYQDFRANTCAQQAGTESEVLAGQQDSVTKKGPRYVDNVTSVAVDGDKATADVAYYFERDKNDKTTVATTFVQEDGGWKICTPGPR